MPFIDDSNLVAKVNFTLPQSRLDFDEKIYLEYKEGQVRPTEKLEIPLINIRSELDSSVSASEQLSARGFAVVKHSSAHVDDIKTPEGIAAYLVECTALLKDLLGCSEVIAWNSVLRRNDVVKEVQVEKQKGPEELSKELAAVVQPPAGVAHVDQDKVWGRQLCGMAAGEEKVAKAPRAQIVNLWRPLHGPVTNAPLIMADAKTISEKDMACHGNQFGTGMNIHFNPAQKWHYIKHQQPDEIVLLKCFDTYQGSDGSALWGPHTAAEKIDPDDSGVLRPRESVEVRLVAVW